MNIKKHLNLLGLKVKDKVTDLEGVVNCISFDLSGCIQADVRPIQLDKEGRVQTGYWLDINRLKILSNKPIIEIPNFDMGYVAEGKRGAIDKPIK